MIPTEEVPTPKLEPIETLMRHDGTIDIDRISAVVGYDQPPFDSSMYRAFGLRTNGKRIQGIGPTLDAALEDLISEIHEALG